jgi:hypothetical protein
MWRGSNSVNPTVAEIVGQAINTLPLFEIKSPIHFSVHLLPLARALSLFCAPEHIALHTHTKIMEQTIASAAARSATEEDAARAATSATRGSAEGFAADGASSSGTATEA